MGEYNFDNGLYPSYIRGINPVDIKDKENGVRFYVTEMLNRTSKIFDYTGLPETITKRDLELLLQTNGFACITRIDKEDIKDIEKKGKDGLYAFFGGLGGQPNAYYMPTLCIIANPYLAVSKTCKIDVDCVIIPNDTAYRGLLPIHNRYATMLVENDISLRCADINARAHYHIIADNDTAKASGDKYLADLEKGKQGAMSSKAFFEGIQLVPTENGANSISQLIELEQYIKASWYNELGLDVNYNMKREAINSTEAQLGQDALLPLIDDMFEQRKIGVDKINRMFGTNITVKLTSAWENVQEEATVDKEKGTGTDNVNKDNEVEDGEIG